MSIESRYLFFASMDVAAEHEALFNEVYDTEHVPFLLKVLKLKPLRLPVRTLLVLKI